MKPQHCTAVAVLAAFLTGMSTLLSAHADTPPPDPGEPTAEQLDAAVRSYQPDGSVHQFEPEVLSLESTTTEQGQTMVTLSADILFTPDSWDLTPAADERIAELLADVPDGAAVSVSGHTDSVIGAVDNQELSENRAEAVAQVIGAARGDLDLEVAGFADSQPAETEDPEDPSTFAANRRVEIVYSG